ncbi:MAG TPA: alpha/beta hydrolase [Pseudolysinimonas sp.]|nr:alpha/beta hydrolase [Pseudolysinimonas sp.]
MPYPPVPFAPEFVPILEIVAPAGAPVPGPEDIAAMRAGASGFVQPVADVIAGRAVDAEDRVVPGPAGQPDITVTILSPAGHRDRLAAGGPAVPGLLNIHGGGMISGERGMDTARLVELVLALGVVAVNVEYRLAPEHPDPAPVEDCYAGLLFLAGAAAELGVDPERLVVMGGSAGGGLAAGVALLARDRGGPALAGQLLLCPMIDDRNETVSSHQYTGIGTWTRELNLLGWSSLLGPAAGGDDPVSPYAAPARAEDLSGLPPAFIEAGSAELFRDENVAYASRIWAAGGNAELHVWAGGIHGFDVYAPDSELAAAAIASRLAWFRRVLGL